MNSHAIIVKLDVLVGQNVMLLDEHNTPHNGRFFRNTQKSLYYGLIDKTDNVIEILPHNVHRVNVSENFIAMKLK